MRSFVNVEPRVRALLEEFPDLPAVVLAERVDWTGSLSWFRENVARLRPAIRHVDPDRLTWSPGDAAPCDLWFPPAKIPLEDATAKWLPVLVITVAHSRYMLGAVIPTRTTEDLLLHVKKISTTVRSSSVEKWTLHNRLPSVRGAKRRRTFRRRL